MNISKQVVIMSAESDKVSAQQNLERTGILGAVLTDIGLPFNEAIGVYNGFTERSFVVVVRDELDIDTLKDFAFKNFGQESILVQDSNQEAHLLFADGKTEQLGRLEQVSEEVAKKSVGYTLMNGEYYTTVKR